MQWWYSCPWFLHKHFCKGIRNFTVILSTCSSDSFPSRKLSMGVAMAEESSALLFQMIMFLPFMHSSFQFTHLTGSLSLTLGHPILFPHTCAGSPSMILYQCPTTPIQSLRKKLPPTHHHPCSVTCSVQYMNLQEAFVRVWGFICGLLIDFCLVHFVILLAKGYQKILINEMLRKETYKIPCWKDMVPNELNSICLLPFRNLMQCQLHASRVNFSSLLGTS